MNKLETILKNLSLWDKFTFKPLRGGITNFNYLITDQRTNEKYVAHFSPKSQNLLGIDRRATLHNTRIAAEQGIGPEITKYFPQENLLILKYIPGKVFTKSTAQNKNNIRSLGRLLRKLHAGKRFKGQFNPFKTIDEYLQTARKIRAYVPENIRNLRNKLGAAEKSLGKYSLDYPCHLDLVLENVLKTNHGIKLLDWEYSANSDCRFDLAMLSIRAEYNKKQEEFLLKSYGRLLNQSQMKLMKAVVHFREAAWGLVQNSLSQINFDYKKYAQKNFHDFDRLVRWSQWRQP